MEDRGQRPNDLAQLRRSLGLTVREVSERGGLSRSAVNLLEHGERRPTPSSLRKLSTGLGVPVFVVQSALGEEMPENELLRQAIGIGKKASATQDEASGSSAEEEEEGTDREEALLTLYTLWKSDKDSLRKVVLKRLANGEITVVEADEMLRELETMPS